jgi:hypothetical protein
MIAVSQNPNSRRPFPQAGLRLTGHGRPILRFDAARVGRPVLRLDAAPAGVSTVNTTPITVSSFLAKSVACLLALALTACVTREPSPQEIKSKYFEVVADKAVIYIYRDRADFSDNPASFNLDSQNQGANYRGTYFRLEVAPGRHRLDGYGGDIGHLEFDTRAGEIYFIRHSVSRMFGFDLSHFQPVPPDRGRQSVLQYEMN